MFKINENYLKLPGSYLFSNIAKKVAAFQEENPEKIHYPSGNRRCDTAACSGDY